MLCALSYITSKCRVIKHNIEHFTEYFIFTFSAFWSRVVGPERKWLDLGPSLYTDSAATACLEIIVDVDMIVMWCPHVRFSKQRLSE